MSSLRPGPNPSEHIPGFTCRVATEKDLPAIHQLACDERFEVGIHNLRLYFSTSFSSTTWNIVENDDGELVAFEAYNELPHNVFFGYQILVREDYRNLRLTRLFKVGDGHGFCFMGNSLQASIKRYFFEKFCQKFVCYFGTIQTDQDKRARPEHCTPLSVNIRSMTSADVLSDELAKYDSGVLGFQRTAFIQQYAGSDGRKCHTAIATDTNGKIVGYGICRWMNAEYSIGPLYAGDNQIAVNLIKHLVYQLKIGETVYMLCVATKRALIEFAVSMQWSRVENEFRTLDSRAAPKINDKVDWPKVHCVHEYWPA